MKLAARTFKTLLMVAIIISAVVSNASDGWTDAQITEIANWHFLNVSSKAQTLSIRGDNAKKEFSKCWAQKMSKEYSYASYQKATKDLDTYVRTNKVVIRTIEESEALGAKFPIHNRMIEFGVQCGNELKM